MFLPSVIYLELFIALFFLPGFFVTLILGIKKFRFLLSFAFAYALLVLTLLPFEFFAQPIARWQWWLMFEWVILALLAVGKTFICRNSKKAGTALPGRDRAGRAVRISNSRMPRRGIPTLIRRRSIPRLIVPLALAGIICGYLAYAGPYLEIPADAWEHIRRFEWFETGALEEGVFASGSSLVTCLAQRLRWYFIHAWLCHLAGLRVIDSLPVLTFANLLVFLLAIYYFGLFLFAGLRAAAFKKMMMAACAALFAAAAMGNMVFAYIRYYALAPTILNYVVFLAALAVIMAWLRSKRWLGYALWLAPLLIITAALIHVQEALFIFFMTLALGIAGTIRVFWRKIIYENLKMVGTAPRLGVALGEAWVRAVRKSESWMPRRGIPTLLDTAGRSGYNSHCSVREWKSVILSVCLLSVFFAGFISVRCLKPGAWISAAMIMPNVGIPPEPVNFIFRNLTIVPPANPWFRLAAYQLFIFYQVVGCWGLFVYLLFFIMLRRLVKIPYLVAGMIIVPLLTAFNPLTVDMLARLGQDPAIYRFHYLIPLPFVGGYLFVHFWDRARGWRRWPWFNFPGSIIVLAGLIGLIFPIDAAGVYAPYSKIYTLRKIPLGNDCRLYADLEKIVAKYENKVILSDGWTAGFLWYFAPKNTYGWIRWLSSLNPEQIQPEPYTWEYLRGRGLIVVNCRDGAPSITGKISRHWPEDILKVSPFYSLEARSYLESHPEKFRKIWSQNRIAIYAVR